MRLPLRADLEARLLRRYKRFFADVETPDGRRLTVHCANPGSMLGLLREGAAVRCSLSPNPKRKLRHTLEMIRVGRVWVGLHTSLANPFAERVLQAGALPELAGYASRRREVPVRGGSRLDFLLEQHRDDARPAYVEVKSVTLCEGRRALFPDSVSERARRHLETLANLREGGARAVLLYVVQRSDCVEVAPADAIDPAYGAALRDAAARGVELFALGTQVTPRGIRLRETLPVSL